MKFFQKVVAGAAVALLFLMLPFAFADIVKTDYNHHANFKSYHTYSWGQVKAQDPFDGRRIKRAVNILLHQRGWRELPSGGQVTVFGVQNVHNQKQVETYYDGLGGGWGMGWGWGGWGWGPDGGFDDSTTKTYNQPVNHLVVDMFNSGTKQLIWRGVARGDLTNSANKDKRHLYRDIHEMFDKFPVKVVKGGNSASE